MTWRAWIWHQLTKERGRAVPRAQRTGRSSRSGVALLLTMSIIALMTVLVTEVVHTASVRIQMAANQRDEAKAEALAQSGLQFYRLLLIASQQVSEQFQNLITLYGQYLPGGMNAVELWQLIPTVSTSMLRLLLVTNGDAGDAFDIERSGGLTEEQRIESREGANTTLKKAFLDFDGDWVASVEDEDRRIYVGGFKGETLAEIMTDPNAAILLAMMSGREHSEWLRDRDLEAQELVGDLGDWTDLNDVRAWDGSRESLLYERLEDDYLPKNGPFDTVEEIRLVEGWNRDSVWNRFGKHLTIYGNGKVNVNTAPPRVMRALLRANILPPPGDVDIERIMEALRLRLTTPIADGGGGPFANERAFVQFLQTQVVGGQEMDPNLATRISVRSTTFRLTSRGIVGDASVEIEAVITFGGNASAGITLPTGGNSLFGRTVYWRVR